MKWEIYKIFIPENLKEEKENLLGLIKEALDVRGYFCMADSTHSVSVKFIPKLLKAAEQRA